jgi:hypothetical protein
MNDPWFRNQLYCRWDELYAGILDPGELSHMIDGILKETDEAIPRNYERWPTLGVYVWPNSFVGSDYGEEEDFLRNWINERIDWMEGKWGGLCIPVSGQEDLLIPETWTLKVYPNPSDFTHTYVSLPFSDASAVLLRLTDLNGRLVFSSEVSITPGEQAFQLPDLGSLPEGIYALEVSDGVIRRLAKLIKQ